MRFKQKPRNELSARSFRALIENAHDGIVLYDRDGNIKFASSSVMKVGGYHESELIGRNGLEFVHPDDVDAALVRTESRYLRTAPDVLSALEERNGSETENPR